MSKTLVLIDGHALAYRQFFALERTGMKNSDNEPTWAVYGFFKAVFDLLAKIHPDYIAVAFDVGRRTFRTEKFEEYKANREAMPDTMRSQLGLICEGLNAFEIPIITKEGFEADDVIGTISKTATENGHKTLILTGDQDSFQLIDKDGNVKVLIPTKGELIEYDWNKVYEKLGVFPDQVIDYKGLRGDTSDNIPGIKGIGEKTAQKLLNRYKHLEDVLADCENIPEKAVKQKICDQKDIAILSKELATIIRDVNLDFDINEASLTLPKIENISTFLRKMQFYTFIKNIDSILSYFTKDKEIISSSTNNLNLFSANNQNENIVQQSLFSQAIKETVDDKIIDYENINKDNLQKVINKIKNSERISIKWYSKNESILGCAVSNGENFYFSEEYIQSLKEIIESKNIKKIGYDAKSDYHLLLNNGFSPKGLEYDVLLASYVKDPNRKHTLEAQALDFLNHIMTEADEKSPNISVKRACDEAYTILKLYDYWKNNLDEKEEKLVLDIELPLTIVLAKMEHTGVAIDSEYLKKLSAEAGTSLQTQGPEELYHMTPNK